MVLIEYNKFPIWETLILIQILISIFINHYYTQLWSFLLAKYPDIEKKILAFSRVSPRSFFSSKEKRQATWRFIKHILLMEAFLPFEQKKYYDYIYRTDLIEKTGDKTIEENALKTIRLSKIRDLFTSIMLLYFFGLIIKTVVVNLIPKMI